MSIKVDRVIDVPLSKIIKDWDVRLISGANDEARVDLLCGLYNDGKVDDPIEVTPPNANGEYRLVEGRTRYAAQAKNRVKTVRVGVLSSATDAEYVEYAYKCNCSGPKPPGLEDLKVTVEHLLQRGKTEKEILTGPLSQVESQARLKIACDQVRSNLNKRGVIKAKTLMNKLAIADPEERIKVAAKTCGITVRALKKSLGAVPGVKKNSFLNEVKKDLGFIHNRRCQWVRDWIVRIEGKHDLGYPTAQIFQVFDHIIKQLQANLDAMIEARERFEKRVNSGQAKATSAGV